MDSFLLVTPLGFIPMPDSQCVTTFHVTNFRFSNITFHLFYRFIGLTLKVIPLGFHYIFDYQSVATVYVTNFLTGNMIGMPLDNISACYKRLRTVNNY